MSSAGIPRLPAQNLYEGFLNTLDKKGISPNRVVTIRTATSVALAGILAGTGDLGIGIESVLFALFGISLAADRVDGDLARQTNQCTPKGEILDAGADKIVVYLSLGAILLNLPEEVPEITANILKSSVAVSFLLDVGSQFMRGVEANCEAAKAYWDPPLSESEREKNKDSKKTENAANIFGKLKTAAIMTAVCVGLEGITPIESNTKIIVVNTLIGVSSILSMKSLYQKISRKKA